MWETEECKNCKYYDRFTDWDSLVTYPCSFAKCQYEPKEENEEITQ